jgi:hypothetical protein
MGNYEEVSPNQATGRDSIKTASVELPLRIYRARTWLTRSYFAS